MCLLSPVREQTAPEVLNVLLLQYGHALFPVIDVLPRLLFLHTWLTQVWQLVVLFWMIQTTTTML
jgi:hypothetical protein